MKKSEGYKNIRKIKYSFFDTLRGKQNSSSLSKIKHGTIIRTGTTCKKIR